MRMALVLIWLLVWSLMLVDLGTGPWLPSALGVWRLRCDPMDQLTMDGAGTGEAIWGLGDLDGDGHLDLVHALPRSLLGHSLASGHRRILFQSALPDGWSWLPGRTRLGPIADYDGDGHGEVPVTLTNADRTAWRLFLLDPMQARVDLEVPLPVGEDRRREPYWDGFYSAVDTMTTSDGRTLLLVACTVLYDGFGRGLLAVDAATGEIAWTFATAPQLNRVPDGLTVGPWPGVDGPVVAVACNSPQNLVPLTVSGMSDDRVPLYIIDEQGELLWTARLDSFFALGEVRRLPGAGPLRLVTTGENSNDTDPARLRIWDAATGQVVAEDTHPRSLLSAAALPGGRLLTMAEYRELLEYTLSDDGGLTRRTVRRYDRGARLLVERELHAPTPGPEYLVSTRDGRLQIYDGRHRMLARIDALGVDRVARSVEPWATGAGTVLVVDAASTIRVWALADGAGAWRGVLAGGWAVALLGVGLALTLRGRRRLNRAALRQCLAGRLNECRHGDFKAVKELRDFFDYIRGGDVFAGDGFRPALESRRRGLVESSIPGLESALDELAQAGFVSPSAERARRDLRFMGQMLARPDVIEVLFQADHVLGRQFGEAAERVLADFGEIYETLVDDLCVDAMVVLDAALHRHDAELRAAGVTHHLDAGENERGLRILADPGQLGFVFDGMISNALRAMSEADGPRELTVRSMFRGYHLDLFFEDTGRGIATEDRERIFSARVQSRGGTGYGLGRSRELLRSWRGDVAVERSEVGVGTVMVVTLWGFTRS